MHDPRAAAAAAHRLRRGEQPAAVELLDGGDRAELAGRLDRLEGVAGLPEPRRPETAKGRAMAALRRGLSGVALLELDGPAGLLELALELLALLAVDALLDRLGGLVHERLRLLEAKAGGGTDDLDHLDLLLARCG